MHISFRLFVVAFAVLTPAVAFSGVKLTESPDDDRPFSIRCRMKVNGKLETATQGGESIGLNMSVDARLSFLERRLPVGGKGAAALRSLRRYDLAEANIDVGGRKTVNRLRDGLKTIVAGIGQGGSRNKRRTVTKQLGRVEARLEALQRGTAVPEPWVARCRTCELPSTKCNGLCWGFWKESLPGGGAAGPSTEPATPARACRS